MPSDARFTILTDTDEAQFYILDNLTDEETDWADNDDIACLESDGHTYFATMGEEYPDMEPGKVYELGRTCATTVEEAAEADDEDEDDDTEVAADDDAPDDEGK